MAILLDEDRLSNTGHIKNPQKIQCLNVSKRASDAGERASAGQDGCGLVGGGRSSGQRTNTGQRCGAERGDNGASG